MGTREELDALIAINPPRTQEAITRAMQGYIPDKPSTPFQYNEGEQGASETYRAGGRGNWRQFLADWLASKDYQKSTAAERSRPSGRNLRTRRNDQTQGPALYLPGDQ